jgi:hypothetical protein
VTSGKAAILASVLLAVSIPSWAQPAASEPPAANRPWPTSVVVNGTPTPVSFDLGDTLGQDSAFFRVYLLKSKSGIPGGLFSDRLGSDLVIKVFKDGSEELTQLNREIPGIVDHPVGRMLKAQRQLDDNHIESLRIEGFDDPGVVLQERFEPRPGRLEVFSLKKTETEGDVQITRPLTAGEKRAMLDAGQRRAILELARRLIDARIGWLDFHLGNIYLKRTGSGWVAGILDQDFIGTLDELKQGVFAKFGDKRLAECRSPRQTMASIADLTALYEKVFESLGWIEYDPQAGRLKTAVFDPDEIRAVIPDLPYLDPRP